MSPPRHRDRIDATFNAGSLERSLRLFHRHRRACHRHYALGVTAPLALAGAIGDLLFAAAFLHYLRARPPSAVS